MLFSHFRSHIFCVTALNLNSVSCGMYKDTNRLMRTIIIDKSCTCFCMYNICLCDLYFLLVTSTLGLITYHLTLLLNAHNEIGFDKLCLSSYYYDSFKRITS